jgi:hypothetical protein
MRRPDDPPPPILDWSVITRAADAAAISAMPSSSRRNARM